MARYRGALPPLRGDLFLIGLGCEYDVPAEAFMVLELRPGALRGASGRASITRRSRAVRRRVR